MEGLHVSIIGLGICILIVAIVLKCATDKLFKDVDNLKRLVDELSLTINYHIMEEKGKNASK